MIVHPSAAPELVRYFDPERGGHWWRAATRGAHALLWDAGHDKHLLLYTIDADDPGDGRGTVLLDELCAWFDLNQVTVTLVCHADRIAWYQRHGFAVTGRPHLGPGKPPYEMTRTPT